MDSKSIGNRIKERRAELGLTLQDIADEVNVNKSTIQRYESGNIKDPKLPVINAISNSLRVNPLWIIGKIDSRNRNEAFEITTDLIETHYRGVMLRTEDRLLNEHETIILREHFQDLLIRYKFLIEKVIDTNIYWKRSKENYSELFDERKTDMEIREMFLKQELDREMTDIVNWINALPSWIARKEEEISESNKNMENQGDKNDL